MKIALIGTRGVPARYGGFETCVEEVGSRLAAAGHEVVVFCRPSDAVDRSVRYRGMTLVHLPTVRRKAVETLAHTALSVLHAEVRGADAAVLFNAANAPLLPVLRARGIPVATHVDGLEWKRSKWGRVGRRYYRVAERLAVRWSDALIADAPGIADYYREEFAADTVPIAYGSPVLDNPGVDAVRHRGLTPGEYFLTVARFEPENHVLEIVRGYSQRARAFPLVVVGSAPYSDDYTKKVRQAAADQVVFTGAIWDQQELDQLYAGAFAYLHGHSVGGTNPSLLRAIGAGVCTVAFDVSFNRDVLRDAGRYFADPMQLDVQLNALCADPAEAGELGDRLRDRAADYDWDDVAAKYEAMCADLAVRRSRRRPSGRRRGVYEDLDVPLERQRGAVARESNGCQAVLVAHQGAEMYGSDRVLLESVRALVASGRDIIVTLPESGGLVRHLRGAGADFRQLPVPVARRTALSPLGLLRFAVDFVTSLPQQIRLIRGSNANVIFVNTITLPTWLLAGRLMRRQVICHVHEAERSSSWLLRKLLAAPLILADRLIVNSEFTREVIVDAMPALAGRTTVVYNPVGVPDDFQIEIARPMPTEPVRLLFLGRISPRKGAAVALEAIARLRDRGVHAHLQYLGAVFKGLEGFERELEMRVLELELSGSVEFLGFRPDIWEAVADNDIVLVPSVLEESFGNTAVEGVLASRPVVCSGMPGLIEATRGYPTVEQSVPGDADSLADAVQRLLARWPAVRAELAASAEEAARRHDPVRYRAEINDAVLYSDSTVPVS